MIKPGTIRSRLPHVPGYTITGVLGSGATSTVYEATDPGTGQTVAVKEFCLQAGGSRVFLNETSCLMTLDDPNIISCRGVVYGAKDHHYLILDYADRGSLRDLIIQKERFSLQESLEIARQVASGLAATHRAGLVHRDLKPENILIQTVGAEVVYKIADLGITSSRLSRTANNSSGSPAYMAPEQFYDKATAASDLYSLGVILFELITGNRPYQDIGLELYSSHLSGQIDWAQVSGRQVLPLLQRLMAVDMGERPRSAEEVVVELTQLQTLFTEKAPERKTKPLPVVEVPPMANMGVVWHGLTVNHLTKMVSLETEEGPLLLIADERNTDCFLLGQRRMILGWHGNTVTAVASTQQEPQVHLLATGREVWAMSSIHHVLPLFSVPFKIEVMAWSEDEERVFCADGRVLQCLDSPGRLLWKLPCDNYYGRPHLLPLPNGDCVFSSGPARPCVTRVNRDGKIMESHILSAPVLALLPSQTKGGYQAITMGVGDSVPGELISFGESGNTETIQLGEGLASVEVHRNFASLIYNTGRLVHCGFDGKIWEESHPSLSCETVCHLPISGHLAVAGPMESGHHITIFAPSRKRQPAAKNL